MRRIMLLCCLCFLSSWHLVYGFGSAGGFDMKVSRPVLDFKADFLEQDIDVTERVGVTHGDSLQSNLFINDRVRLSYADFRYQGNVDFLSKLKVNSGVTSQWNLTYGGIGYLMPIRNAMDVDMHVIFDVKGYEMGSAMQANVLSNEVWNKELFNLRGIALSLGFGIGKSVMQDKVYLYGEVMGLPLGDLGSYFDMDAGMRVNFKDIAMNVGYRAVYIESAFYDIKNAFAAQFKGPYFGLSYAF